MSKDLVIKFSELQAAADTAKNQRVAAEARKADAEARLKEQVAEVKKLGFQSMSELELAITEAESQAKVALEAAELKLREAGYLA